MSYEFLFRDVKSTFPNPQSDGISLELNSVINPNFHVSHAFKYASQLNPATYNFGVFLQQDKFLFHGQLDNEKSLSSKIYYTWHEAVQNANPFTFSPSVKTKMEAQITAQQSIMMVEQEVIGESYAFSVRATNPNPISEPAGYVKDKSQRATTGIFTTSFMQKVFKGLSLGGEFNYTRPTPEMRETSVSVAARYIPESKAELPQPLSLPSGAQSPFPPVNEKDPQEIYTAMYTPANGLTHLSYWKKLNTRMEVAAEFQGVFTGEQYGGRRDCIATLGFKLQTLFSQIKSQIDTTGRIATTCDYVLAPGLQFNVGAEMDYSKGNGGQGKAGVGFTLEA